MLGIADILIILLIVAGPLKPAIVFAALTAKSDAAFKCARSRSRGLVPPRSSVRGA